MSRTMGALAGLALAVTATAGAGDGPKWGMATKLYADRTARRVGDVLTVLIVEESALSKDASRTTEKQTQLGGSGSISAPLVDGLPLTSWGNVVAPSWSLDTTRTFSGKGTMGNKDEFSAKVAVAVREVLPNGNLLIEGKRTLIVQDERVEMILAGSIRPEDVTSDNTVMSTRVADASITYTSRGPIARNQNKGLVSRLLDWVNIF